MKHQKRLRYGLWIFRVLYYGGILCMLSALFVRRMTSIYVGVIVVVIAMLFAGVLLRCPVCGKPLSEKRIPNIPRFCPNCGKQLREE